MDLTAQMGAIQQRHEAILELLEGQRLVLCVGDWALLVHQVSSIKGGPRLEGACTTEERGYKLVKTRQPQLLICQDELEQGHGLSLIQRCKALQPQLKTLVLVSQVQGFRWKQALELGVDAVCNRQRLGRGVFLEALRSLQGEGTYLDRSLLAGPNPERPQLTPRELEVLQGLHQGDQTKELARRLGLGPNTVKGYVRQIHQKLGVRCRTQAVLQGLKVGLIKAD